MPEFSSFKEGDTVPPLTGKVVNATYGDFRDHANASTDVTSLVQALVNQGGEWQVNNGTMQGDPCPGMGKTLTFTLEDGDDLGQGHGAQDGEHNFREGVTVSAMAGTVVSATYGDHEHGKTADVTSLVQALVNQGGEWQVHNGNMQGDPCPGMGKTLTFTIAANPEHSFREGDTVPALTGTVVSASYGDHENSKTADVTSIVQILVNQGDEWQVHNGNMHGDPCPGMGKTLCFQLSPVPWSGGSPAPPQPPAHAPAPAPAPGPEEENHAIFPDADESGDEYVRVRGLTPDGDNCVGAGRDYEANHPGRLIGSGTIPNAMFTGHAASFAFGVSDPSHKGTLLGVTQFVRILQVFERNLGNQKGKFAPGSMHYGVNGQWIQDAAQGGGKPWGSIEGGIFCCDKVGRTILPKYLVGGSTHRYDMYSDTAGGWGFDKIPLPANNMARLIIANSFVMPLGMLSFEPEEQDGEHPLMFGSGPTSPKNLAVVLSHQTEAKDLKTNKHLNAC